jgi:hypothetical protein
MSGILGEVIFALIEILGEVISDEVVGKRNRTGRNQNRNYSNSNTPYQMNNQDPNSFLHIGKSSVVQSNSYTKPVERKHQPYVSSPVKDEHKRIHVQPVVEQPLKTDAVLVEPMESKVESKDVHLMLVNRVKLEILLLSYIYIEDDGKVSFSEKTKLKNHFRSFKNKLDEEDLEAVKELMLIEPSLHNIRAHVNQNEMNDIEVDVILDTIQSMCGMNKEYLYIMDRIRKSIKNTINY